MSFRLFVGLYLLALNLGFAALQINLLRRRRQWPRTLAWGIAAWTVVMLTLGEVSLATPPEWKPFLRHWLYFPMAVQMVWNLLFIQILFLVGIMVTLVMGRLRPVKRSATVPTADISRRRFLYLVGCGTAPAAALALGVHGTLTRYDLQQRSFRLPVRGLPPELEGFTIAHVSDLHVGIYCGPKRLNLIREATNDLKADLVVVTGDIINSGLDELADAFPTLHGLRSRYGTYLCEGNHDVFPGPGLVRDACRAQGLPFLDNSQAILTVNGRRLILGGLPWMRRGFEHHPEIVGNLYPARQEGDVRILLAHHPHLFDIAQDVDVVLTGHTHGGQIMVGDVGFGPLFFRYWSGYYRRGDTSLVVSNGGGDWFPCRVGAPAEIGLLTLTRAA